MFNMKKVIEQQSKIIKDKFAQYQEKQHGNFDRFLQKQEEKKDKISQKLLEVKYKLDSMLKLKQYNPHKAEKLSEKITSLESELQNIEKKEQVAKDFHLVFDGLQQQLQMCQNLNIELMPPKQRNENYTIICSIKRQALNVRAQVFKQKHISPLTKMAQQCDQLLNDYLKAGVNLNVIQPEILNLGNENNDQDYRQPQKWKKIASDYKKKEYLDQDLQFQERGQKNNKAKQFQEAHQILQDEPQLLQQQQQLKQDPDSEIMLQGIQKGMMNLNIDDTPTKLEEKSTSVDESKLCQICFEHLREYVVVPCGHFVYCGSCKDLIQKQCLICRTEVQQVLKIFQ